MLALKLLALRALAAAADTGASSSDPCFADATNTFHAWIDPYASELGSWKFLECGDTPMPVLAVEKGVTYTFEQFDPSNWYHPLAFGTEPDDDEDDLATHYLNGAQIDEDAYDDGFVVSRVAWLDASGQSQDEDEGGDDEEEDAGEAGDEDADADEDRRLQAVAGYSVVGRLRHDHDPSLGQHHRDDLRCGLRAHRRGVRRGAPERPGGRQGAAAGPRRRRDRPGLARFSTA